MKTLKNDCISITFHENFWHYNLKLSKDISNLKLKLINTNIRFADGEIIEINENIRGNSVFVIQSTSNPANDNIMELC